jgi:tRNA (guanine37-N1)-methyltransferase
LEEESFLQRSISKETKTGKLEYPHYTRPEVLKYKNKKFNVPKVLLSGNHKKIEEWRTKHRI